MAHQTEKTILAIHPGALGDVVLLGQFLQGWRAHRPIRLAAGKSKADLLVGLGAAQEALDYDLLPMEDLFKAAEAGPRLASLLGGCQTLVSCFGTNDIALQGKLMRLSGASHAVFLPIRPPADFAGHLVDYWCELAELPQHRPAAWHVPEGWRQAAMSELALFGCRPGQCGLVVIQPGAGSPLKCWPLERFMELAEQFRAAGLTELLVLGPTETEWWPDGVIAGLRRRCHVLQDPPLPTLAGVLAQARLFVGNDSGPGHLAAAVGTGVVSLFGPSNPAHFAPLGKTRLLSSPDLAEISVSQVMRAAGELL